MTALHGVGRLSLAAWLLSVALLVLGTPDVPGNETTPGMWYAVSDTDSVEVAIPESLAVADTNRASRYFPEFRRDAPAARVFRRKTQPMSLRLPSIWNHSLVFDTTSGEYLSRETIGGENVRLPRRLSRDEYLRERERRDVRQNWDELIAELEQRRRQSRRGGLGFNIAIPGGRQSAFTTIFGKPDVSLRVTGTADIRAGFDYRQSEQQSIFGQRRQIDPEFKQDLRLGIDGSIGDKMLINVNYDTQNRFDFENELKLNYRGYEDEIIQSIEAGNVFLQTPSSLIRGGQSLFGIKSEFQIGGVHLTTVMSQQEGESSSVNVTDGTQETEFDIKPIEYDDGRHFFLGYYFRNRWEPSLSDPPRILLANGFQRITEIEIWRFEQTNPEDDDVREVVAMVDLGESETILTAANDYTETSLADLPDAANDQYSDADIATLRDRNTSADGFLGAAGKGLNERSDFQTGPFKKLVRDRDYTVNEQLGYITLSQRLQDSEAIAVSFRYIANGQVLSVGDLSTESGGANQNTRLVLKLLRPRNPDQPGPSLNPAAWYLEMRNIYSIRGRGINPNGFELDILYTRPGQAAQPKIPELGGQRTLLDLLGLDRLNEDGAPGTDERFDYRPGFSIIPSDGLLIFPYLEPFGERLEAIADANGADPSNFAFTELYRQKKESARTVTRFDVYRIRGEYKGTVKSFYDLDAFAGVVPGTVQVTSAGATLTENVDYIVDYNGSGSVTIINEAYLIEGRGIDIDYESNSFFNLQKKTLLGLRADYDIDDRLAIGATAMRLSQKSPVDKFRLGEEPISNFIWGLDGALDLEANWLTRAIDKIPLLQTRETSSINVRGEFAQLRPGNTQTNAFQRSRRDLQKDGRDFTDDELNGISFLDDFEGFENTFSLMQPGSWRVSSAPDSIGAVDNLAAGADSLRTNWRAAFTWYRINQATLREFEAITTNLDAVRPIRIDEVFPDREISGQPDQTLSTMDLYLDPRIRGPYNYTTDLSGFLANPKSTWGGMIQRLPEGFSDFDLKNTEFVEFIIRPFADNVDNMADEDAKLMIDLGFITEDILPDERLNEEDGLSTSGIEDETIFTWGRLPTTLRDDVVKLDDVNDTTEDLGLDGLASYGGNYPANATEAGHFQAFLNSLDQGNTDPLYRAEVARSLVDPSGDDYHFFADDNYFGNDEFFPGGATVQQRFLRFFSGFELNGFESQRDLATAADEADRRGNSQFPDSEDLNNNSAPDILDSYFQYEVPLNRNELDRLAVPSEVDDFVVTEITSQAGERTGWYQIRIPIRDFNRRVGSIQDFRRIESIRIWTSGHAVPATIRFAALELVGSQWRKGLEIPLDERNPSLTADATSTRVSISSVNNEENSAVYLPPRGTIISETRLANGTTQTTREQSMVVRVENLEPQQQLAIYKPYTRGVDLLKYSNIRMFVHAHGLLADGTALEDLPRDEARSKARLFIRLGANETSDYYEYEQPLTPSRETVGNADELWQTNQSVDGRIVDLNSVNILISALNQLKVERDQRAARADTIFWSLENGETRGPDASQFAPPGTRLGIKGTPSLASINTIVVGVRNPAPDSLGIQANQVLEDLTVWINELRVAGYDNASGWSALTNADIKLADLGRIKANFQTQTDGFGSLASTLDDRDQTEVTNWSVTTDLNLDQPIPERFGWSIPVSVQLKSNNSTPRFSPNRGDIRISDIVQQIDSRTDLSSAEKSEQKKFVRESAATKSATRSISARVSKSGSDSRLLRNTLDALSVSYSYSQTDASNPSQALRDDWRWTAGLNYRLSIRKPRTVRPFGGLDGVPILKALSGLRFNYLPNSVTATASTSRSFSESQDRSATLDFSGGDPVVNLADNPLRQRHDFKLTRNFAIQYNPFQFLNLGLDTNTNHSLHAMGVDTLNLVVNTEDGTVNFGETFASLGVDSLAQGVTAFEQQQLVIRPGGSVLREALGGDPNFRTDAHGQNFNATIRTQFRNSKALDWIDVQPVQYNARYTWTNGPVGRNDGASISNQADLRTGMTLNIQDLWRKFAFYRDLERAQRDFERNREAERKQRQDDRKAYKEARAALEQSRANQPDSLAGDPTDSTAVQVDEEEVAQSERDRLAEMIDPEGADSLLSKPPARFRIPLPNPRSVLRRAVLAITGIRDLNVTYSASRTARSTSIGTELDDGSVSAPYSIYDAVLYGRGPSLRYRFGLDRTVPRSERALNSGLQVSDLLSNSNRFTARTTLNVSPTLTVNLNWTADLTESNTITVASTGDTETLSGTNKASVWAFNPSYVALVESQVATYRADAQAGDPANLTDANGDGRVVLTNASVVADFRNAFVGGKSTLGKQDLLPFPFPGWTVNYTGFGKWPLVRSVVQSASIRHVFNSDYSADYRTNSIAALDPNAVSTFQLGGRNVTYLVPQTEASSIRLNRRFSPLVGVDFVFRGRLQTNVSWNKSSTFSLSTSNFDVSENSTNEVTASLSWQKTGLKIPFLKRKRLNNRLSFTVTFARSKTLDQRYLLNTALIAAAEAVDQGQSFDTKQTLSGNFVQEISSHTRTTIAPQVSYVFSNRVTANFTLKYENFEGDTRQPSSRNINGTFNFRVNISG